MESLDFSDVVPSEQPVKGLLGKDYVLRAGRGEAVLRYQEAELGTFESVTDEETGKRVNRRVKTAYKIESFLVSLCLFDLEGKPVPQSVVESFPPHVQRKLYVAAMQMTYPDDDLASLKKRRAALDAEIGRLEERLKNAPAPV